MKRARKRVRAGGEQSELPGRVRYRPPQGKASDRALNRLKAKSMNGMMNGRGHHENGR